MGRRPGRSSLRRFMLFGRWAGPFGLEPEMARKAFQRTWFLVYDLIIAGMCLLGILLALALIQPWGRRLPRWLLGSVGWCAVGLLLLRSGGSMIQMIYWIVTGRGRNLFHPMFLWELWFYIGAVLFSFSFWKFRRFA